jgi:uncharacterized repeat protein (TIGR03803 family)
MATGTFSAQIGALNSKKQLSAVATLTIVVEDNNQFPVITSSTTVTGTYGQPFTYQITATNDPTSYSGTLPSGFLLSSSTGAISAFPYVTGTFYAQIQATNQYGTGPAAPLTIIIFPAPPSFNFAVGISIFCSFDGNPLAAPRGGLLQARDGNFYGVACTGAVGDYGKLYRVTSSGSLTTLFTFSGTDGNFPQSILVQGNDGDLYGTTYRGGNSDEGTVFRITTSGSLTTLWSFSQTDGSGPSGLIQGSDGNYYGTTYSGGSDGYGTVFRITASGSLATLHSFQYDSGGAGPLSRLTEGQDGNYYGTTSYGGTSNCGTVFRITSSGSLKTLCSFSGTWGATLGSCPKGELAQGPNDLFYGSTYYGGNYNLGSLFRMTASGSFATLCSFTGTYQPNLGANPCGLVPFFDGNYYGITETGGNYNYGTQFNYGNQPQLSPSVGLVSYVAFNWGIGANPTGSLLVGRDGSLYGTTTSGGAYSNGNIFRIRQSWVQSGTTGMSFNCQITASNSPQTFSAQGLPPGLALISGTGNAVISGTPATSGTFSATVFASNSGGTGSSPMCFVIQPAPPVITSTLNAPSRNGAAFAYQIAATNNPTSFNATGLPPGLSVTTFGGLISGTPTQTGTFTASITANNPTGTDTKPLTISILHPLDFWKNQTFSSAELSDETVSGDMACPAGDGIPNLMKYALNLEPKSCGTGGLPKATPLLTGSGSFLSIAYTRVLSATELLYTIEVSDDLQTWNSGPGYTTPIQVTNDPGGQTQSVVEQDLKPMDGASHRFIRLKVTKSPAP